MVKIYGHVKQHSCEISGKRFVIKWSLKKHSCKYFAEGTVCSFHDVGYKFLHDDHTEKFI
jgi:hypothetical protein